MNIIERGRAFLQSSASVGGAVGVGLEAVSAVWEHADDQERQLPAAAVVFSRPRAGAGATPSVSGLRQVVLGAIGAAGTRQLVCPGGAPGGGGSLAALGACRCGARRSCCARGWDAKSAGGCGGRWIRRRRAKPVIWPPARCSVGWIAPGGRRRPACRGNCRALRQSAGIGHGWPVGPAARQARAGGAAGGRQCQRAALAAGGGRGRREAAPWQRLFERARQAGLDWMRPRRDQ